MHLTPAPRRLRDTLTSGRRRFAEPKPFETPHHSKDPSGASGRTFRLPPQRCIEYKTEKSGWTTDELLRADLENNIKATLQMEPWDGDLSWPYEAGPAPGILQCMDQVAQRLQLPTLYSTGLVQTLGTADTHLLQVLLTAFTLEQRRGGSHLRIHYDDDSPTIWRREAKSAVKDAIPEFESKVKQYQSRIDAVLYADPSAPCPPFVLADSSFPFRYANGGTLPILEWKGSEYYCLFYRDIEPMGWNIANGGSDSRDELLNPLDIVERELREELIVIDRDTRKRYTTVRL